MQPIARLAATPRPRAGRILLATALALLAIGTGQARASLLLSFDKATYTPAAGQPFDVSVFLTQSTPLGVGEGDLSTSGVGLLGASIKLTMPGLASIVPFSANPGVDPLDPVVATLDAANNTITETFALLVSPNLNTDASGKLLIGTFTLTAGAAGSTTGLTVDVGADHFVDGSTPGNNLDSFFGAAPTAIVAVPNGAGGGVTVVPEPSTIGAATIALAAGLGTFWSRRRVASRS